MKCSSRSQRQNYTHLIPSFPRKVAFGHDGEKGRLAVDGLRAWEGRLPGNFTFSPRASLYLGSSPSRKPKVSSWAQSRRQSMDSLCHPTLAQDMSMPPALSDFQIIAWCLGPHKHTVPLPIPSPPPMGELRLRTLRALPGWFEAARRLDMSCSPTAPAGPSPMNLRPDRPHSWMFPLV